jgi:hypothetical protein
VTATFAAADGREVHIVQLVAPNPCCWAVFYRDVDHTRADGIDWKPVACYALAEWDSPHGREQDVVPLVVAETGEMEIATDDPEYAGVTYDAALIAPGQGRTRTSQMLHKQDVLAVWRRRWLGRRRVEEAYPPEAQNLLDIGAYQSTEEAVP